MSVVDLDPGCSNLRTKKVRAFPNVQAVTSVKMLKIWEFDPCLSSFQPADYRQIPWPHLIWQATGATVRATWAYRGTINDPLIHNSSRHNPQDNCKLTCMQNKQAAAHPGDEALLVHEQVRTVP